MLNPGLTVQLKSHLIGYFDCELMGSIFFPTEFILYPCVVELDVQNIILCGLHEGGLYQRVIPLHGLVMDEVPHFHCDVSAWLEQRRVWQPFVQLTSTLCPLPIFHVDPSRIKSLVASKLHHMNEGL